MFKLFQNIISLFNGSTTGTQRADFESMNKSAIERISYLENAEKECREDRERLWKREIESLEERNKIWLELEKLKNRINNA